MKVMVFGLGLSGISAATLAIGLGHTTCGADKLPKSSLSPKIIGLEKKGLACLSENEAVSQMDNIDLMVLSPGISSGHSLVRQAVSRNIPVISEIEWAYRNSKGKVIGITGSNGKSTTTALTAALLKSDGIDVRMGGNIGTPFCDLLQDSSADSIFVLELSSFQLENNSSFKADIAILLNVTPDHQDRYPEFESYVDAKAHLFDRQKADDISILNLNDAATKRLLAGIKSRKFFFSLEPHNFPGAFLKEGTVVFRDEKGILTDLFSAGDMPIKGPHNIENAMAASIAAYLSGTAPENIRERLKNFRALPHRLELVAEINGAKIYNDSKATNTDSVLKALVSFERNIILLLGGKDKGADFYLLASEIEKRCKKVIAFGAASKRIVETIGKSIDMPAFDSLKDATDCALSIAGPGDVVLLSPACASFDEFQNYEDRGNCFRNFVLEASGR
jgi:UDP-N-acetylmuramoylalanine--D-glutamate ligase